MPPSSEAVAALAAQLGFELPPERLPLVADALAQLLAVAAVVETVDLADAPPAAFFSPAWTQEPGQ